MEMETARKGFLGVSAAFMVSAVTPLLIPFALDSEGNLNAAGYAAGLMFWAGLIAGCAGYALLWRKSEKKMPEEIRNEKKPAAIRFFSNRVSKITDIILIISFIVTVYCMVNTNANQTVAAVVLFIMLAALYLHFLLNGKIYFYIEKSLSISERRENESKNEKA